MCPYPAGMMAGICTTWYMGTEFSNPVALLTVFFVIKHAQQNLL